jgi:putative drug exporter of the RND superfamily
LIFILSLRIVVCMTSLLSHIAGLVGRRPRIATLAVLLAIAALIGGAVAAGGSFKDDFTVPGIESQKAQDLLEQRFPAQSGTQATVVFSAQHAQLDSPGAKREIGAALSEIGRQPHVVSVEDPFKTPDRLSDDRHTAYATVSYDQTAADLDAAARERLEDATAGLPRSGVDVAMSGEPIAGAATGGFPVGEVIGLAIAVALLIAVLRNLRAARNALGAAFAGIGLGFGALMWAAAATDVPGLAPTLAGMLGLGAGIDYALLLAARQQEELRAGHAPVEAARRANATAGHSALTAAGIVLVSISGLLVTGIPFVGRAGVAAGLVVLACAIVCVVLLPARFARAGRRMLPRRERAEGAIAAPARAPRVPWVTRRPVLALVAAAAIIAALAAPAAGLELGQPDDRNLTTDTTQRQAYDRLAEGFGAGVNGPLVVAVSVPEDAGTKSLHRLTKRLSADPEIVDVAAPALNAARDTAVITITPRHGPQDQNTRGLVDRLRQQVIPAGLRDTGATAYLGGRTARYGDEANKIAARIPLFAAAVVGLSLLLLLAAFRSWRISVLSAVFNLASIAAAYGVVALAFQTAIGAALLGIEQQPVVPYVPLFMFAILFGLSTDYNVFLLSRVREEWGHHGSHRAAIAAASASTRKIVTAAGAIMMVVFLGFATDPDPVIKMTGIGLATAVLVDVTLVRLFMAPAALTLLGDRLWPSRRARRATPQATPAHDAVS